MKDNEIKNILNKIADSQLITAEAIKVINHNTTTTAEFSQKISESMVQHCAQTTEEHKGFRDILERYWKLILIMLAFIGAIVGVKLFLPQV